MKPWQPMEKAVLDRQEEARARKLAADQGIPWTDDDEVWLNDEYQATVRYMEPDRHRAGACHLSVKRRDKRPAHDWRELQAIKNEVMGWEREAIELYPAESRLVDQADQTHLWVMPAGARIEIGYDERVVITDQERLDGLRASDPALAEKGSQRDWRPGISTGPDYQGGSR